MLRFINSLTKEIIIDDGDLLLCDFKNSNITFLYSNDECYFIDNDIKIIVEIGTNEKEYLNTIIKNNNIKENKGIYKINSKLFE